MGDFRLSNLSASHTGLYNDMYVCACTCKITRVLDLRLAGATTQLHVSCSREIAVLLFALVREIEEREVEPSRVQA